MADFASALWNKPAAADSTPADPVTRSLRLAAAGSYSQNTGDSSAHLDRNSIGTPTDGTKWTFSAWVKKNEIDSRNVIFSGGTSSTNWSVFRFRDDAQGSGSQLFYDDYTDGSNNYQWRWSPKLRDPSAWYNLMLVYDASQSAMADKLKLYINGVLASSDYTRLTAPTTHVMSPNKSGMNQIIGNNSSNDGKANLLIADVYFLDGVAKTVTDGATDFTESNDYGGLKPKEYTGTDFGNNGFHIDAQPAHDADLLVSSIDRNDGDTLFADAAAGHTITKGGDPEHSDTVGNPFDSSGTAISFDGTGDYLSVATSSDFDFGSGSYTYEGWFYFNGFSQTPDGIFSRNNSSTQEWAVCTNSSGTLQFFESVNNSYNTSSFTFSTGQWYHIALCKNGTTYKVYVDADEKISATLSSAPDDNLPVIIGRFYDNYDGYYLDGYCFDFRAQKGVDTGGSKPSAAFELNPVYIGGDQSGNKNHFQPTNISMHDVMLDVPTKNYATMSPVSRTIDSGSVTFGEGNLSVNSGGTYNKTASTIAMPSGKWYAEIRPAARNNGMVGVCRATDIVTSSDGIGYNGAGHVVYVYNGRVYNGNGTSWTSQAFTSADGDDVIQLAVDVDNLKIWFGLNNTWEGTVGSSGGHSLDAGEQVFAYTYRDEVIWNFGQDPTFSNQKPSGQDTSQSEFYYAPPNGFKSLNTSNLADPTVTPSENFAAKAYEGQGGSEEINLGFTPDLTWIKRREDSGYWHGWYDSNRGLSAGALASNSTNSEDSTERVASFDSDTGSEGFTLASSHYSYTNTSGKSYVSWNWKAHQTPPTPTSYSTTLTLTVDDDFGSGSTGWGTTELEVFEGTQSLGTVGQPTYDSVQGDAETVYEIKTNNASKIKIVWKTVDTSLDDYGSDRFYNIEVVLTDSSSNELASWYPSNYYGGSGYGPDAPEAGDVFRAQTSSADESTTGVLEVQGPTVNSNSEKYNAAAGFTMFTYTGNSSTNNDTMLFNHSLGVPIDFAIGKCRSTPSSGTSGGKWVVWHKDLSQDYYSLYLNETESENDVGSNNYDTVTYDSAGWFANASTGSQHHVKIRNVEIYDGSNTDTVRMVDNSKDFVFYGFTGVEGYSKFGKYTGGSDPFIYTGFRVGFWMVKRIDSSGHWTMFDSARDTHNLVDHQLEPNYSNPESPNSTKGGDFLSNGFKVRSSQNEVNASGGTYIYAAFAESPFKHANAR